MREDFYIEYPGRDNAQDEQIVVPKTGVGLMLSAAETYDPSNREYSAYLKTNETQVSLTQSRIEELSVSPQSDLSKTQEIIQIGRQYVNKNDLVGLTRDCVENNVNTEYRLTWIDCRKKKTTKADRDKAQEIIADFNEKVNLDKVIRDAVVNCWQDGTYIMYLREKTDAKGDDLTGNDYVVDHYPLGVAEISDYEIGGDPCVLLNIDELKSRLTKTHKKTKKSQPLFFKATDEEIKKNYPVEVVKGFQSKEKYVRLDIGCSGVMRIGNQGKQYGLSPIFRALAPTLMIEKLEAADRAVARNRAKTVIAQYLRKETAGPDFKIDTYPAQAYAHKNMMAAWEQSVVVMTTPASVEKIEYIEPRGDMTNIDTLNYYRTKVMTTLGITFYADKGQSLGATNLGTKQLMRTINKISEQLEYIIPKWYRIILQKAGIDPIYAPSIQIIDSEMLDMDAKMELARTLFTTFNGSYQTAFDTLGLSLDDEIERRTAENDEGLEKVFMPRESTFTKSGNSSGGDNKPGGNEQTVSKPGASKGGRTPIKDPKAGVEKQQYDKIRNENLAN